jgi:pyruvate-ferredoxin/flavodoxin oxidoreductase
MNDRARVDFANVRGVQFLQPLFEFSGACAGCGETRISSCFRNSSETE